MGLRDKLFGWRARTNLEKAYSAIAQPLFVHLHRQYSDEIENTTAMELAKAVTFELLGPPKKPIPQLIPVDPRMVELKLSQLKDQREICQIVSVFRYLRAKAAKDVTVDAKLRELGILLPEDQIQLPASHRELMQQAQNFAFGLRRF